MLKLQALALKLAPLNVNMNPGTGDVNARIMGFVIAALVISAILIVVFLVTSKKNKKGGGKSTTKKKKP